MEGQDEEKLLGIDMVDMPDNEISFSSFQNYCVCVVDLVNSTEVILKIGNPLKVRKYILTFINSMASIARNFGATIVKNVGDGVIFYFPQTSDSENKSSFKKAFDCFATMLDALPLINTAFQLEGLPPISYRISADYGRVEVAKSTTSREDDLFGSTMSLCVKINSIARKNGIVIGGDLYRIAKSLHLEKYDYKFYEIQSYDAGLKFSYSVYEVTRNAKNFSEPFWRPFEPRSQSGYLLKTIHEKQGLVNIMIIDYDASVLSLFRAFLDDARFNVDTFRNTEEALGKFAIKDPCYYSLVIIDIRMISNGPEFYERLKRINPDTKILFLSAVDSAQELQSMLPGIKPDNILRKPVDMEQFIKTVEGLVSK